MNTEHEFNSKIMSKELAKLQPSTYYLKLSDRYREGISDFLIFQGGKTVALETKFIQELPERGSTKILKHKFSGGQITFLESMHLAGHLSYGLVAVAQEKAVYIVSWEDIPESGNWSRYDFLMCHTWSVQWNNVSSMLSFMFKTGGYSE